MPKYTHKVIVRRRLLNGVLKGETVDQSFNVCSATQARKDVAGFIERDRFLCPVRSLVECRYERIGDLCPDDCRGWDVFEDIGQEPHIERCDSCQQYDSDQSANVAALTFIQSATNFLGRVAKVDVAEAKLDGESAEVLTMVVEESQSLLNQS